MKNKINQNLMRTELPYGERIFLDGTKELFNRDYEIILSKGPQNPNRTCIKQTFYYTDSNPPWKDALTRSVCEKVLRMWLSR